MVSSVLVEWEDVRMGQTSRDERRPEPEVETARMDDPGFHNAMAHLYHKEMHRMTA